MMMKMMITRLFTFMFMFVVLPSFFKEDTTIDAFLISSRTTTFTSTSTPTSTLTNTATGTFTKRNQQQQQQQQQQYKRYSNHVVDDNGRRTFSQLFQSSSSQVVEEKVKEEGNVTMKQKQEQEEQKEEEDYTPTTTVKNKSQTLNSVNDNGDDGVDVDDITQMASDNGSLYQQGILIIGFITLLNASLAPIWHTVFVNNGNNNGISGPPPLFLNAMVSIVAFVGLLCGGDRLKDDIEEDDIVVVADQQHHRNTNDNNDDSNSNNNLLLLDNDSPTQLTHNNYNNHQKEDWQWESFRGGMELGLWKGLGTTCHIYGMSLTTANHGAFLLQLTTLIVPVLQGLRGAEEIPRRVQWSVLLALSGIIAFTQDPSSTGSGSGSGSGSNTGLLIDPAQMQLGDGLVLAAAFFYSLYDIQTFYWGREVPRNELVTIKIGFQTILSILLCAAVARDDTIQWLQVMMTPSGSTNDGSTIWQHWSVVLPVVLWSGLIVNALATFLQVNGIQQVGPTRAQTIFASQPLWASALNYVALGETIGLQGCLGGGAFLGALFLAATTKEAPTPITQQSDTTTSS